MILTPHNEVKEGAVDYDWYMTYRELSRGKSFKVFAFVICLILALATFYLDLSIVPDEISLLLPYILVIYFITQLIGNQAGIFFSILTLVLRFISSSKVFADLSAAVFINLTIKAVFLFLILSLVMYNRKLYLKVEDLSLVDELTGLYNRRGFRTLGGHEMKGLERSKSSHSLLYIDIDEFKAVNDSRGHEEGDRILLELARVFRSATRSMDIAARMGGDEFCVLLPGAGQEDSLEIAGRIEEEFARASASNSWPTTLSLGLYSTNARYDLEASIEKADALMYRAKQGGKNAIECGTD